MVSSIIYKRSIDDIRKEEISIDLASDFKIVFWKPSFTNFIPESYPTKYFIYWFFHFLRIFKNRNYSAILIYHKGKVVSCILAIPAYFKWPFMGKNDVQIAYVITDTEYRGQGLAAVAIENAFKELSSTTVKDVWYVTSFDNKSSQRLCTKLGFLPAGTGSRKYFLKFFHVLQLKENKTD